MDIFWEFWNLELETIFWSCDGEIQAKYEYLWISTHFYVKPKKIV